MNPSMLSRSDLKRRALLGATWFVNTQIVSRSPAHDANHGRVLYNRHLPTGQEARGLSWSQGRAIMCLLGAWELSGGRQIFLDSAVRCGDYLRYALQVLDARDARIFGSFREEVPTTRFCYPRDGIEAAFGLLMLYLATGMPDYLERCELFADWYIRYVMDPKDHWPRGTVDFDDPGRDPYRLKFFQAGGAPFFWHLYQVTNNRRYLNAGLRPLADGLLDRFLDFESGAILSPTSDPHHSIARNGRTIAINDDGAALALTCAHAAFGRNGRSKYLAAAVRYAQWLVEECPRPLQLWAAPGMHVVSLTEMTAVTGDARYAAFGARLMAAHACNQIVSPRKLDRHGAFRGEDEPVQWYVSGAKPGDFVTTRSTAYGTLGLLRLTGLIGPSYSSLGFRRFASFSSTASRR